jgi:alpha-beta hydrolase superfamily lysophospholipase
MGPVVIIAVFLLMLKPTEGCNRSYQPTPASLFQPRTFRATNGCSQSAAWARLLAGLDRAVQQAARSEPDVKITLVGCSAGGALARLYLYPDPFLGRAYQGLKRVNHLITLGSPHHSQGS